MGRSVELVIFDCDGVLVETEKLSVRTDQRVLADLGITMSQPELIDRFVGRTETYWQQEVSRLLGREVSAAEFAAYDPWYREAFQAELTAVPGIESTLDALEAAGIATCVASSGTHDRMRFTLGHTGLRGRFEGRIYSAEEVREGKPAPDLFLYAAERMGRAPGACLVVEDSVFGIQAALAAGMRVVGYSGSVIAAEVLQAAGATAVVDDLRVVPALLASV